MTLTIHHPQSHNRNYTSLMLYGLATLAVIAMAFGIRTISDDATTASSAVSTSSAPYVGIITGAHQAQLEAFAASNTLSGLSPASLGPVDGTAATRTDVRQAQQAQAESYVAQLEASAAANGSAAGFDVADARYLAEGSVFTGATTAPAVGVSAQPALDHFLTINDVGVGGSAVTTDAFDAKYVAAGAALSARTSASDVAVGGSAVTTNAIDANQVAAAVGLTGVNPAGAVAAEAATERDLDHFLAINDVDTTPFAFPPQGGPGGHR